MYKIEAGVDAGQGVEFDDNEIQKREESPKMVTSDESPEIVCFC
jgi:hypothetical protein